MTQNLDARGSVARALMRGIPAAVLAALVQGSIALVFDVGILYPVIGYVIGSIVRNASVGLRGRRHQVLAILLTYFAVAFSPLIPFGRAVGFDPRRMRNAMIGLVLGFIPEMVKTGVIGVINVGLLVVGLRQAWVFSVRERVPAKPLSV